MKQTRARLTWYGAIAFTILSVIAMFKGMESVALAALAGITTIITTYHASQGYTKGQYIKTHPTDKNLEG
jgi:hypothetical protein